MASVAMLVGGTLVNALAVSGSNYLFSLLHRTDIDEERKHHDKAVKQLQLAQAEWSRTHTLSALIGSMRNSTVRTMQSKPPKTLMLQCMSTIESPANVLTR